MLCPVSRQSPEEEILNLFTHGLGLVLSLFGIVFLLKLATTAGPLAYLVAIIYGLSLVQLFGLSTFYHAVRELGLKKRARILDHCSIYLLIAGSYTPFMALALGGWSGWGLLLVVWGLAGYGIYYKNTHPNPFGVRSVLLYLFMGWLVALVFQPLTQCLSAWGMRWLVAGGLAYTFGILFYAWQQLRYSHGIWHLFVLAGAAGHYFAVITLYL